MITGHNQSIITQLPKPKELNRRYDTNPSHLDQNQNSQQMTQSNKFKKNQIATIPDPQNSNHQGQRNITKISQFHLEQANSKSKNKIRMYGSKRSIIPYTCVINGNGSMLENKQNVVDENSMINSKIDNSHVCEIEKTKNKLVQKSKIRVFGSREKIPPSITVLQPNTLLSNSEQAKQLKSSSMSKIKQQSQFKKQVAKSRLIGKQRKITAEIKIIEDLFQLQKQRLGKLDSDKFQNSLPKQRNEEQKSKQNQIKIDDSDDLDINKIQQVQRKFINNDESNGNDEKQEKQKLLPRQKGKEQVPGIRNSKRTITRNSINAKIQIIDKNKNENNQKQNQPKNSKLSQLQKNNGSIHKNLNSQLQEASQQKQKNRYTKRYGSKKGVTPYMDYIPENESDKSKEESFCLQNRVGQKMKQTIVIKGNKLTSNIDSINEQNIQNSMGQNNQLLLTNQPNKQMKNLDAQKESKINQPKQNINTNDADKNGFNKQDKMEMVQTKSQQQIDTNNFVLQASNNKFIINNKKSSVIITPTKKIRAHISSVDQRMDPSNNNSGNNGKHAHSNNQVNDARKYSSKTGQPKSMRILTKNNKTIAKINYIQDKKEQKYTQQLQPEQPQNNKGQQRKCQNIFNKQQQQKCSSNQNVENQNSYQNQNDTENQALIRYPNKQQKNDSINQQQPNSNNDPQERQPKQNSQRKPSIIIRSNKSIKAHLDYIQQNKDQQNKNQVQSSSQSKLRKNSQKRPSLKGSNKSIKAHIQMIQENQNIGQNQNHRNNKGSQIVKSEKQQQLNNMKSQINFILQAQQHRISKKSLGNKQGIETKQQKSEYKQRRSTLRICSNKSINAYVQYIKQQVLETVQRQQSRILQQQIKNIQKTNINKQVKNSDKNSGALNKLMKEVGSHKQFILDNQKVKKQQVKNKVQNCNHQNIKKQIGDQGQGRQAKSIDRIESGKNIPQKQENNNKRIQENKQREQSNQNDKNHNSDEKCDEGRSKKDLPKNQFQQQIPSKIILFENTIQSYPVDLSMQNMQKQQKNKQEQIQKLKQQQNRQNNQYPLINEGQQRDKNLKQLNVQLAALIQPNKKHQVKNPPTQKSNQILVNAVQNSSKNINGSQQEGCSSKKPISTKQIGIKVDDKQKQNLKNKQSNCPSYTNTLPENTTIQQNKQEQKDIQKHPVLVKNEMIQNTDRSGQSLKVESEVQSSKNKTNQKASYESKIVIPEMTSKPQFSQQMTSIIENSCRVMDFEKNTEKKRLSVNNQSQEKNKQNRTKDVLSNQNQQKSHQQNKNSKQFRNQGQPSNKSNKDSENLSKKQIEKNKKASIDNKDKKVNCSSSKTIGRRGSHFELVPLDLENHQTYVYKQLDVIESKPSNQNDVSFTHDLSHRSNPSSDKGNLNGLVRVSPKHRNGEQKQKQQQHQKSIKKSIKSIRSIKEINDQIYELKLSKQKEKQRIQYISKNGSPTIKFNTKNSKSHPNLIKKTAIYKFKEIQQQNKQKNKPLIRLQNNAKQKSDKNFDDDQSESKSKYSRKKHKKNQKSKLSQNKKIKIPSPYLNPAFNNIQKIKIKNPYGVNNQSEISKKQEKSKYQQSEEDDRKQNIEPNYKRNKSKNRQFNQRQFQKIRGQYQKIKKMESDSKTKQKVRKNSQQQSDQYYKNRKENEQQRTKTFKFLKAHSHQFSYLYPTAQIEEQDKKLNQRLKQLDKKLKRSSKKISKIKQHQYIVQARRFVKQSEKCIDLQF